MKGSKAIVYVAYSGSLKELSKHLSDKLSLPAFYEKSAPRPPHVIVAMTECLGHEVWLEASDDISNFNYRLETQTSLRMPSNSDNLTDLSDWLEFHLNVSCDLDTYVERNV